MIRSLPLGGPDKTDLRPTPPFIQTGRGRDAISKGRKITMADPLSSDANLDTEELMHLALKANERNDTEQVIAYLKRVLGAEPDNGYALYLLGAQHAQLKMYARAIEEMSRAIEVEPNIPATCHFQLGLLYLTSGAVPEAMMAWAPLDQLEEDDPLRLFKRGLVHLIQDEFEACVEDLERGIALNPLYPDLSRDMQMFADKAKEALQEQTAAAGQPGVTTTPTREPAAGRRSADLSAYRSDPED